MRCEGRWSGCTLSWVLNMDECHLSPFVLRYRSLCACVAQGFDTSARTGWGKWVGLYPPKIQENFKTELKLPGDSE